ncbi:hypothetical protein GCM10023093_05480 [Nemorincola caseinilytica]|uniref:Outer membrane protein beta-barrel domain-containing protein n=2 Tax=Nemorincola caseinilytica TaxID=2054315 RepID=A0ABP8N8C6_9BACT
MEDDVYRRPNIRAGAVTDVPLRRRLHLQTGALFTTNGFLRAIPGMPDHIVSIHAIDIPLFLSWHMGMKHQSHFFISGGVFADINVGGHATITYTDLWGNVLETQRPRLSYGKEYPNDARRMSYGLGLNAGYQLKSGFFVRAHYQRGLTNLNPAPIDDTYFLSSNNYGLTIGYLFKTSKGKEVKQQEKK